MRPTVIFDALKTVYFNFRFLPLSQAIHFPFLVSYKVKVSILGQLKIDNPVLTRGMIILGKRGFRAIPAHGKSYFHISKHAIITFHGNSCLSDGFYVWVDEGASIDFGGRFYVNTNFQLRCNTSIIFGEHFLGGWNISINDYDGHFIYIDGKANPNRAPITLKNNVWVASNCTICKGVTLGNGCVCGQNSLLLSGTYPDNTLIVGHPAKVVKYNIKWEE